MGHLSTRSFLAKENACCCGSGTPDTRCSQQERKRKEKEKERENSLALLTSVWQEPGCQAHYIRPAGADTCAAGTAPGGTAKGKRNEFGVGGRCLGLGGGGTVGLSGAGSFRWLSVLWGWGTSKPWFATPSLFSGNIGAPLPASGRAELPGGPLSLPVVRVGTCRGASRNPHVHPLGAHHLGTLQGVAR